nr:MAG TPA: hypothetical protein [Caudoviricetes sp.]
MQGSLVSWSWIYPSTGSHTSTIPLTEVNLPHSVVLSPPKPPSHSRVARGRSALAYVARMWRVCGARA